MGRKKENNKKLKSPFDNLEKLVRKIIEENISKIPELKWKRNKEYSEYISNLYLTCYKIYLDSKIRYSTKGNDLSKETEESINKDILEILGTIDIRFLNAIEYETPKSNRDDRIKELNGLIAKSKTNLAMNKGNKFIQESEKMKLKALEKEYELLWKDFFPESLFKNRIFQLSREEVQRQCETEKFQYENEIAIAEIVDSKSQECAEKVFNKVIKNNEVIKFYNNNIKEFDKIILYEVRTLLPLIDNRFADFKLEIILNSPINLQTSEPEFKELKEIHSKEFKIVRRLSLSPNEGEILNSKIVEKVNEFIDLGKGSQEQAYNELSKDSLEIFSYSLTPKQIEGRYTRHKED